MAHLPEHPCWIVELDRLTAEGMHHLPSVHVFSPQQAMAPHSLALALWLTLVALKLHQFRLHWRERRGLAISRAFRAELERRRQIGLTRLP